MTEPTIQQRIFEAAQAYGAAAQAYFEHSAKTRWLADLASGDVEMLGRERHELHVAMYKAGQVLMAVSGR